MTRSGSFPDRVRVADADDRDFRSCAGEQREEDPHGAFLRLGCAAPVRVRGVCLYGAGRALAGSGLHGQLGARRAGGGSAPQKLGSTAACGFCKPVPLSQSVAAQVSAGDACGPRPLTAGLNDRHARAKPLGAAPIVPGRGGPRGSRRARERPSLPPARRPRHRSRRRPLLESKAHSLLPLPELDAGAARPKAAPRPQWRSCTSGAGSRRTSTC